MKHHCPMCGEQWDEDVCASCGWREGKPVRYTGRDKRVSGEGAMKGWATRRRKMADRKVALARLLEVAESMTGVLVFKESVSHETVVNWRDRITSAFRILEGS